MNKLGYVYILANKPNGTLYIGVTSDIIKRVHEHKTKQTAGFSKKYNTSLLVYFETCLEITAAIEREKRLKRWRRAWKVELIEETNPHWEDLYPRLL